MSIHLMDEAVLSNVHSLCGYYPWCMCTLHFVGWFTVFELWLKTLSSFSFASTSLAHLVQSTLAGFEVHIELVLDVARHPSLLTGNVLAGPGGDPVRFHVTASPGQAGVTETCSQCVFSVALTPTQLDIV